MLMAWTIEPSDVRRWQRCAGRSGSGSRQERSALGGCGGLHALRSPQRLLSRPGFPTARANAITGANRGSLAHLNALQGGLVLLGWGLLFAVCGWVLTIRRDIP